MILRLAYLFVYSFTSSCSILFIMAVRIAFSTAQRTGEAASALVWFIGGLEPCRNLIFGGQKA